MAVYIVTGKLGAGKTLAAVARIRHYLNRGLPVATNLDIYMEHFRDKWNRKVTCYRLPDKPRRVDMDIIGRGNETYDESLNGLVVLDECGTWLNARGWQDKDRQGLIEWMVHARKLGWDVIFIVQDISVLDKQAREMFAEHVVWCKRLDRYRVPVIGWIVKALTGYNLTMPRLHIGVVKYGDTVQHPTVDRWTYLGDDLYKLYDTKQIFRQRDEGVACYLTPWHLAGRYQTQRTVLDSLYAVGMFLFRLVVYIALHIVAGVTARSAGTLAREAGLLRVGVPLRSRVKDAIGEPKTARCPVVPLRGPGQSAINQSNQPTGGSENQEEPTDASRYSITRIRG
jgi:Zonular occludens toxin (Zot)